MSNKKATIIDDEKDSRKRIKHYLKEKFSEIKIISEAQSVKSGLESMIAQPPDLLFLDAHLPDGTGFELLSQLKSFDFEVIFVTTYEKYALEAFKCHAFSYILKPINQRVFNKVVGKYLNEPEKPSDVKKLINNLLTRFQATQITLPSLTGFMVVKIEEIVRLQSEGSYTKVFLNSGKMILTSKYLKEYEKVLSSELFCRIHHSHLINLNYMKEYIKGRGGQVILQDGTSLNVSQNKKQELLKFWT